MGNKNYKLRCRINGILVTDSPTPYDIVWIREFNPLIYSIDTQWERLKKEVQEMELGQSLSTMSLQKQLHLEFQFQECNT